MADTKLISAMAMMTEVLATSLCAKKKAMAAKITIPAKPDKRSNTDAKILEFMPCFPG